MCSLRSRAWMIPPPFFGSDTPPRGVSDGGRAWVVLEKKLMVDGWWLLVNEREGVLRWGKVCAVRGGLDLPPPFCFRHAPQGVLDGGEHGWCWQKSWWLVEH